ncbi:MAG: hypothetical protein ACE37K_08595 [Planctomycetota bacterium]
MRIKLSLAVVALAAGLQAQVVLPLGQPLTSANQGNPGGAVYLNMTCNTVVTWDQLEYVSSDASPAGNSSFEIYFGPSQWQGNVANQGPWILIGQSAPVAIAGGVDETVVGVISGAGANTGTVTFAPGTYGIALVATGHSWGYQNGTFNFSDPNVSITTGGASNAPFTLPTFQPRSVNGNLTYTVGGTPIALASQQVFGQGCYANYTSFYEVFANTASGQDLSNTSILMAFNSATGAYDVSAGTTAPVPAGAGAAVQTFTGNDDSVQIALGGLPISYVTPNGIQISPVDPVLNDFVAQFGADGWVGLDDVVNTSGNPSVANFLSGGARVGNWQDMDPLTAGTAWYEFDAANAAHIFTWDGIPSRGLTDPNTIQVVFFPNLDIEIRLGVLNLQGGGGWPTLTGYTPGNGALDPGSTDLSASLPFSTQATDSDPLRLEADATPVLGQTVNLITSNETTNPGVGITIFSTTPLTGNPLPPIDLIILNAPGCFANVGTLDVTLPIITGAMSSPFPIPNAPAFIGFEIGVQSAWLDAAANGFGLITSNGVLLKLGV